MTMTSNFKPPTSGLLLPGAFPPKGKTRQLPTHLPQRIKLMLKDDAGLFEADTSNKITLGRSTDTTPVTIDLSIINAQQYGVSRQHACLEAFGERLMLKDLGSVNGTCLNGEVLTPHYVYQVNHGDEIRLGKLRLHIFFMYV